MFPPVSIVIPCYNSAQYVSDAVESALSQTYPNVQVIVVDDGSTDDSLAVLSRYEGRIELIAQENCGAPTARNVGMAHARGDFVQFLDADDELFPRKIEVCMQHFDPGVDLVVSGRVEDGELERKTNDPFRLLRARRNEPFTWDTTDLPAALLRRSIMTLAPVFRKSCLLQAGGWAEGLANNQDIELGFRLATLGASFRFIPDKLARVRHHASPTRIRLRSDAYVGVLHATRLMHRQAVDTDCLSDLVRDRLASRYARWGRIAYQAGDRAAARDAFGAAYSLVRHPKPSTIPMYNMVARLVGLERLQRIIFETRGLARRLTRRG
jgi:glycosyltransferase involved in cell wall biosynthesis